MGMSVLYMSVLYMSVLYMSRFANNAFLGGGVRVRVWIREQRKIKRRSRTLLSLCWQPWTSLVSIELGADFLVCTQQ